MTDGERLFVIGCLEYCQVEGDISDSEYVVAQKIIDKLKGECRVPVEGMRTRLRQVKTRRIVLSLWDTLKNTIPPPPIELSIPPEPPVDWDKEAKKLE